MGKYIRKAKQPGEVAVMEVTQSNFGVRTRAKTLALQRLLKSSSTKGSTSPASSGSYLQLRSRRLEKPSIILPISESRRQKQAQRDGYGRNPKTKQNSRVSSRLRLDSVSAESRGSASLQRVKGNERRIEADVVTVEMDGKGIETRGVEDDKIYLDLGAEEASFGENDFDFDGRERSMRESTPCSLIRDPDSFRTPGSTTRPTSLEETNQRLLNSSRRPIPTAHEMDKFFTGAEEEQQRQFIEKYNFDPVKDKPLPGRYEWEKLGP